MNNKMIQIITLSLSILGLCIGCGKQTEQILLEQSSESLTTFPEETITEETTTPESTGEMKDSEYTTIVVYICGAVKNPGVYTLQADARVYQAIEAAGGLLEDASDTYINQAKLLQDGEQITIPTREEAAQAALPAQTQDQTVTENRINLNTADEKTLMKLNGIGETRAAAIVAYREKNGPFRSIEDIKKVEGIKDAIFQKISDNITVD